MPTSYTSLLGLALPVTGELAGQWGTTVNDYITQYVDSSVAGTQTISGSQTAVTLSVTNGSSLVTAGSGSTGSAQFQIINCTGNPAGLLTITAPASSRQYIIINATSTSQSVKIVGSGPTTGVTILSGEKAHVAWNGSDFVKIATQSGNGDFVTVDTTNLEVTNIKAKDGTAAASIADSTGVISITSNPILSGGTANGVLYLNGSKVATSGSVLVFDGTNLGLGVTPSAWESSYKALDIASGGAAVFGGTSFAGIANNSFVNSSFQEIYKTSNPALQYLQVVGQHRWFTAPSGTAGTQISFTQAMTLDSSGRLLLGTTTTTNNIRLDEKVAIVGVNVPYNGMALTGYTGTGNAAYRPVIDFNRSRGTTDGSMTVLANNDYLGSIIFRGSDGTSFQDSAMISAEVDGTPGAGDMPGRLTFWTTPDGSTTVTERARITSGGALAVGLTTPTFADGNGIHLNNSSGAARFRVTNNTTGTAATDGSEFTVAGSDLYIINNESATMQFWTAGTERARITSGGDLLLGGTSTAQLDGVFGQVIGSSSKTSAGLALETQYGAYLIYTTSDDALIFWDSPSNTERARIDSSGNLLVGVTSGSFHRFHKSIASDFAVQSANTSATTPYVHVLTFTAAAPNDATSMFLRCDDTGVTGRIQLRSNGGIANYQANDVNLSDRREKTNFAPAKSYLDTICAIPVQTFNYIDQSENDPGLTLGVVAQDVQAVAPELVMESNWGTEDEPKMRLSIYQTDLQYALMKCIQEQQTIIQSLTARIAALESKGV